MECVLQRWDCCTLNLYPIAPPYTLTLCRGGSAAGGHLRGPGWGHRAAAASGGLVRRAARFLVLLQQRARDLRRRCGLRRSCGREGPACRFCAHVPKRGKAGYEFFGGHAGTDASPDKCAYVRPPGRVRTHCIAQCCPIAGGSRMAC